VNERVRHGLLELVLDVPAGDQLLLRAATPTTRSTATPPLPEKAIIHCVLLRSSTKVW
jgi:hypothetical protein